MLQNVGAVYLTAIRDTTVLAHVKETDEAESWCQNSSFEQKKNLRTSGIKSIQLLVVQTGLPLL